MAQATISRRRPCPHCGGRYFVRTISIFAALIAIAIALGGFAKAVLSSGVLSASNGNILDGSGIFEAGAWAIGGIVVASVVASIGRGYRCIACDSQQ